MKLNRIAQWLILCAPLSFLLSCNDRTSEQNTNADNDTTQSYGGYESQAKWGEHIVSYSGCNDCHSPKKMSPQGPVTDSSLLLSGHPAAMPDPDVNRADIEKKGLAVTAGLTVWVGPWGISYAANLTPDTTGLAGWTDKQFIYAIREGKYKGLPNSRPLLPPMPWHEIRNMTDDELKAVFAYLKSLKPINNLVPTAKPPVLARR